MLDIFDILGPVMVGPSSSHTAGAVRIGRMARTLLGGAPVKADIGLYGSFAETGRGHGTDRALVAGLLGMRPDDLRIPQSFELAKEEGLDFYIHPIQLREAHPNTVVLKLRRADGNELMLQAASVGGGRIRVDKLNGVEVQFTGDLNTLVVQHQDVAGKVADETRELSNAGINIATMSLWRDRRGGDALIVIETDQKVSPEDPGPAGREAADLLREGGRLTWRWIPCRRSSRKCKRARSLFGRSYRIQTLRSAR